MTMWTESSVVY